MIAAEMEVGQCIYRGNGHCRGPQYGEVYEVSVGQSGSHPGFLAVTRAHNVPSLWGDPQFHGAIPTRTTLAEAREAAIADASRRNQGN